MPRSSHRQEAARISPGTVRLSREDRSILEAVRDHGDPNGAAPWAADWQARSCRAFSLRFCGLVALDVAMDDATADAGSPAERQIANGGRWRLTAAGQEALATGRVAGKRLREASEQMRGSAL